MGNEDRTRVNVEATVNSCLESLTPRPIFILSLVNSLFCVEVNT